eukprot:comp17343_c0_seq1/m.16584 comp17343_c0_seq1/g.16584  ORF comp17343_c0_seq1/g.16584 comp17343_c0_seq1/m.16584 type:complete len:446 (-) comp17343_c0_seq1:295-1632(-)
MLQIGSKLNKHLQGSFGKKHLKMEAERKPAVVMCGTGEYTTGYVHGTASQSDKKIGVVALCMFELRRLGKVGNLALVGTTGRKFAGIRQHLEQNIRDVYNNLDVTCSTFPADDVERDPLAYQKAIDTLQRGDMITIFTPDDTHYEIALYAIQRGVHVLVTKPAVKTLKEHRHLVEEARKQGVFVMMEVHKRFDPIYRDAVERIRSLGDFGYFHGYMSQPKLQLETFRSWAGRSSDISYYLNSHHIDFHCWALHGVARPLSVVAMGSTGVAQSDTYGCPQGTEDTITLLVQWENLQTKTLGHAIYTSSWSASAKAEVHSQQRFHYMGHKGEIRVDQAHRGYEVATDSDGYRSVNPLFMAYSKDHEGNFAGHHGYGYKSFEEFVTHCTKVNAGKADCYPRHLATFAHTEYVTAILEAGRLSLNNKNRPVNLVFDPQNQESVIDLSVA